MIQIINQNTKNEFDETKYILKINAEFMFEFYHRRENGLAACLQKAAEAAAIYEKDRYKSNAIEYLKAYLGEQ